MYRIDNPPAWNQAPSVAENIPVNHGASTGGDRRLRRRSARTRWLGDCSVVIEM